MSSVVILLDEIASQNEHVERHRGTCSYNSVSFTFEYDIITFKGKSIHGSYVVFLDNLKSPGTNDLQKACEFLLRYRDYLHRREEYAKIWEPFFNANRSRIMSNLLETLIEYDNSCSRLNNRLKGTVMSLQGISNLEHGICDVCRSKCKVINSSLTENEHLPWWYELGLDEIEKKLPLIEERFNLYIE